MRLPRVVAALVGAALGLVIRPAWLALVLALVFGVGVVVVPWLLDLRVHRMEDEWRRL